MRRLWSLNGGMGSSPTADRLFFIVQFLPEYVRFCFLHAGVFRSQSWQEFWPESKSRVLTIAQKSHKFQSNRHRELIDYYSCRKLNPDVLGKTIDMEFKELPWPITKTQGTRAQRDLGLHTIKMDETEKILIFEGAYFQTDSKIAWNLYFLLKYQWNTFETLLCLFF